LTRHPSGSGAGAAWATASTLGASTAAGAAVPRSEVLSSGEEATPASSESSGKFDPNPSAARACPPPGPNIQGRHGVAVRGPATFAEPQRASRILVEPLPRPWDQRPGYRRAGPMLADDVLPPAPSHKPPTGMRSPLPWGGGTAREATGGSGCGRSPRAPREADGAEILRGRSRPVGTSGCASRTKGLWSLLRERRRSYISKPGSRVEVPDGGVLMKHEAVFHPRPGRVAVSTGARPPAPASSHSSARDFGSACVLWFAVRGPALYFTRLGVRFAVGRPCTHLLPSRRRRAGGHASRPLRGRLARHFVSRHREGPHTQR